MKTIQQFREFLGSAAETYNDAQLEQLRQDMYAMAELLVDIYLAGRQGQSSLAIRHANPNMKGKGRDVNKQIRG